MPVTAHLKGTNGLGAHAETNAALRVATAPRPPGGWSKQEVGQERELRQFLKDSADSQAANVDGSSTAQEFFIQAADDRILWVRRVSLVFYQEGMSTTSNQELRKFGQTHAAPGLTNGLRLVVRQGGVDTDIFVAPEGTTDGVKSMVQFYRYGEVVAFEAAISSTIDFLQVNVDFEVNGGKGIGLYPGSQDKVSIIVQDDLTGFNLFETLALGTYEVL